MSDGKAALRGGELRRYREDAALSAELDRCQVEIQRLNALPGEQAEERQLGLRVLLGHLGDGAVIRPPFYCDFGDGISIGARTFINSCCTMLDTGPITVGAECFIATNVQLIAATHPVDPVARRAGWEYSRPVVIADGVWLGAGVIVLPGVTIGENTVVGAGSVVTRDLPAGVVAYGNPARVAREIGPEDRLARPRS